MLSINEAAAQGIERVHSPRWAIPFDHFKIDIIDGEPGPWLHLYSPINPLLGNKQPEDIFGSDYGSQLYEPYTGPLPDSEEFKTAEVHRER